MMKMNRKKWLCGVAACLCLTGSTVPVFADKADDEQKFYVTGTKFSGSGKLYCKSSRLHATTTSNTATISKNTPSASASYTSYALPRYEYFMHCTASVGSLHVEGRYTP